MKVRVAVVCCFALPALARSFELGYRKEYSQRVGMLIDICIAVICEG